MKVQKCKHKWVDMEDGTLDKFCLKCSKKAKQGQLHFIKPKAPIGDPTKTKDVNDNTSINNTSINIGLGGCSMEEMERQLRKSMETMFSRDKRINSR